MRHCKLVHPSQSQNHAKPGNLLYKIQIAFILLGLKQNRKCLLAKQLKNVYDDIIILTEIKKDNNLLNGQFFGPKISLKNWTLIAEHGGNCLVCVFTHSTLYCKLILCTFIKKEFQKNLKLELQICETIKTRADTAQTMAYSDSQRLPRQFQMVKSVTVNESVSQLLSQSVNQYISQSVSFEKITRKS